MRAILPLFAFIPHFGVAMFPKSGNVPHTPHRSASLLNMGNRKMDAAYFALWALAVVVFAPPAIVVALLAGGILTGFVKLAFFLARHFTRKATVEVVTPVKTVPIPAGMTYEQFDAWLTADPFKN